MDDQLAAHLIERTLPRCRSLQTTYFELLRQALHRYHFEHDDARVADAFAKHPVIDIGAGVNWRANARTLLGARNGSLGARLPIPLRVPSVIAVDPFVEPEEHLRMRLVQQDGLSYLREQPDASAHVFLSGIDWFVIPSHEYLARLVQEAHRVVPPEGFCFANTPDLQPYADKFFPSPALGGLYWKRA